MSPSLFQKRQGRVLALFGIRDRFTERYFYIRQAEAQGAELDGFVLKYPDGSREWCDYECAHELKPVQQDLFGEAA